MSFNSNYRGYDEDFKADMISDAYLKVVKNLKNMKEQFKDSFYSYIVLTIHSSFKATLAKHYRQINLQNRLMEIVKDNYSESIGKQK